MYCLVVINVRVSVQYNYVMLDGSIYQINPHKLQQIVLLSLLVLIDILNNILNVGKNGARESKKIWC